MLTSRGVRGLCCRGRRDPPTTHLACVPSTTLSTNEHPPSARWDSVTQSGHRKAPTCRRAAPATQGGPDQYCCLGAVASDRLMCSPEPPPVSSSHMTLSERSISYRRMAAVSYKTPIKRLDKGHTKEDWGGRRRGPLQGERRAGRLAAAGCRLGALQQPGPGLIK